MKYLPFFVLGVVLAISNTPTMSEFVDFTGETSTTAHENVYIPDSLSVWLPDTQLRENRLLYAIWKSEGGAKTRYPYGIRSIPCSGASCKQIALNTIRNQVKRWNKAGNPGTYLESLHKRYAPGEVRNDPSNLNLNWKSNVEYFLREQGEEI